jgi:putative Ca2+/H+ antiporter (TMEM165/GDT1 family)
MNWRLFLSSFSLIFLAELPDKTAFATLFMATRGSPLALFTGVALAFLVQTLIAVLFGSFLGALAPRWVHLGAGILFIVFAVMALLRKDEDDLESNISPSQKFGQVAWKSFVVIFMAEWGDLTQLASASLVARFGSPLTIFCAATLALWSVTAIAILLGHHLKRVLHPGALKWLAVTAFASVGIYLISTSASK